MSNEVNVYEKNGKTEKLETFIKYKSRTSMIVALRKNGFLRDTEERYVYGFYIKAVFTKDNMLRLERSSNALSGFTPEKFKAEAEALCKLEAELALIREVVLEESERFLAKDALKDYLTEFVDTKLVNTLEERLLQHMARLEEHQAELTKQLSRYDEERDGIDARFSDRDEQLSDILSEIRSIHHRIEDKEETFDRRLEAIKLELSEQLRTLETKQPNWFWRLFRR